MILAQQFQQLQAARRIGIQRVDVGGEFRLGRRAGQSESLHPRPQRAYLSRNCLALFLYFDGAAFLIRSTCFNNSVSFATASWSPNCSTAARLVTRMSS